MKKVVDISSGPSIDNFQETCTIAGQKIEVIRIGVDFDLELMKSLIMQFDGDADVMCLSGLPLPTKIGKKYYIHPDVTKLFSIAKESFVVPGTIFREVYYPWAIREYMKLSPFLFNENTMSVYCGLLHKNILPILEESVRELRFADPLVGMKLPLCIKGNNNLDLFLQTFFPLIFPYKLDRPKISDFSIQYPTLKDFYSSDIFLADAAQLSLYKLNDLTNKTFIIDFLSEKIEKQLKDANAKRIISCVPRFVELPIISFPIMEAIFQAVKGDRTPITHANIFSWIDKYNIRPERKKFFDDTVKTNKFAFVIHPLTKDDLFKHRYLKPIRRYSKDFGKILEKGASLLPGIKYGKITGIKSDATNIEAEGTIYTLLETPKEMMKKNPETVYKKLIDICHQAKKDGVKIIGLGAYTKIIGDAGITVNQRSPIPVTTGNSLSAAATLWAATYAVHEMNLTKFDKKKNRYEGTAMIVGATGSIGKVSARILANQWKEIILVAPRPYKLLELKSEIETESTDVTVTIATDANEFAHISDLIITTTSAQGEKIIDIEKIKPGCVVCDVSRPFDITKEDAIKRPDVLIIASGEVELPGVNFDITCNIGLPHKTVYACLAETAILALEGRFEAFTLSREIDYNGVIEIDRLARKHGVRLSAIMGHDIEITKEEIHLCREHAKKKLGTKQH